MHKLDPANKVLVLIRSRSLPAWDRRPPARSREWNRERPAEAEEPAAAAAGGGSGAAEGGSAGVRDVRDLRDILSFRRSSSGAAAGTGDKAGRCALAPGLVPGAGPLLPGRGRLWPRRAGRHPTQHASSLPTWLQAPSSRCRACCGSS